MEAPPVGLLPVSDKELHTIFDALSQTAGLLDSDAVQLSRTCRRLDAFYRLEYVTTYDSTRDNCRGFPSLLRFDDLLLPADAIARALLRLPRVKTLSVFTADWNALRVRHRVPDRIRKLALHLPSTVDDALAALPAVLPALSHLDIVDMYGDLITAKGFAGVALLSSLRVLELGGAYEDQAAVLAMLSQLSRLRSLKLHRCFCLDPEFVEGLPRGLADLTFSNCPEWTGNYLRPVCALPNLRSFALLYSISERAVDWSAFLPAAARLASLVVHDANFDDSGESACFRALSSMKNLSNLSLHNISSVRSLASYRTYGDVLHAAATLPMLKTLSVKSECHAVRDEGGEGRECAVSPSGLTALGNGRVRRSLVSLSLECLVTSSAEGCSLEILCTELFSAKLGMPRVSLDLDFRVG